MFYIKIKLSSTLNYRVFLIFFFFFGGGGEYLIFWLRRKRLRPKHLLGAL